MTELCFGYVINYVCLPLKQKINYFVFYFVQRPTNAQLIDKLLYCSYMFRHYCIILRELVVITLLG
jgi:hypothetical protein